MRHSNDMTGRTPHPFPHLNRVLYPDQALPVSLAIREHLIPDASPGTLELISQAGHTITDFTYTLTSDSRHPVTVPIICSTPAVAERRPCTLVQTLGLTAGRRAVGATWSDWQSSAHRTARINGSSQYIPGAVPDGRWQERLPGGTERDWILEYSHGEFTSKRLAAVIHTHGRRPKFWMTPSHAHAQKLRRVMTEALPGYPLLRVDVVNWTGGTYDLP